MPGNLGSLGSLFIDVAANTANFETDIGRAQRLADRASRDMQRSFTAAGTAISVGLAAAAGGAVVAISRLNDIANSIANYKELSERIGDTAQAVASLKPVADVSGVALETVSAASIKLTASLSKQTEESSGAASAIKALGLDFKTFQQLAPVAQIEAVAAQFAKFEDNANKTAAAVALFGKSGAELIPFLNDLAERGERQVVLTQQQIDQADEYAKRLDRAKGDISTLAQRYAADMIPALDTVLNVQKELLKPEYISAAQQLATSLVNIAGGLAKITANTVGLAQFLGESLASAVVGPNDAVRISDEIDRIGERIAALKRQQGKAQPGSSIYEADARAIAMQEAALAKLQDRLRLVNQYNAPGAAVAPAAASPVAAAVVRPSLAFSAASSTAARAVQPRVGPQQDAAIRDVLREIEQREREMEAAKRERERIAESLSRQYGPASVGGAAGETARFAAELDAFTASREEILARGDDYYALLAEAARAHQLELTRIEQEGIFARAALQQQQVLAAADAFASIADAALLFGKKGFAVYKAAAIASTVIGTYDAAQKAASSVANIPVVGPALAVAAAAAQVTLGLARVGQIRAQNIGSRRFGGPVNAGGVYEIAEPGNPELLKYGNKTILAMGSQPGTVLPAKAAGAGMFAGGGGRDMPAQVTVYNNSEGRVSTATRRLGRQDVIEIIVEEAADNASPIARSVDARSGRRARGLI